MSRNGSIIYYGHSLEKKFIKRGGSAISTRSLRINLVQCNKKYLTAPPITRNIQNKKLGEIFLNDYTIVGNRVHFLRIPIEELMTPLDLIVEKVSELADDIGSTIKDNAMPTDATSLQHVFNLVVDEYSAFRIRASLFDNVCVESEVGFAFTYST
jgi:hypothetical protein